MSSGLRNEPARQRHRQWKKEQCGCISVPASAVSVEASNIDLARRDLSEKNNFGWGVCDRCHPDPEFNRKLQVIEKPYLPGMEDKSSTYVICVEDGGRIHPGDRKPEVAVKATQTSEQKIQHVPEASPDKKRKESKKNLISEFFYIPLRQRSRSRSPSTGKSKPKYLGELTDEWRMYLEDGESSPKTKETEEKGKKVSITKSAEDKKNGKKKSAKKSAEDKKKDKKMSPKKSAEDKKKDRKMSAKKSAEDKKMSAKKSAEDKKKDRKMSAKKSAEDKKKDRKMSPKKSAEDKKMSAKKSAEGKKKDKKLSAKKSAEDKKKKDKKIIGKKKGKVEKDIEKVEEQVNKDVQEHKDELTKDAEERKKVVINDLEDNEDAFRQTVSETKQSKRKKLGSAKQPKKIGSKKLGLRAGTDTLQIQKTDNSMTRQTSQSSVVYHLEPLQSRRSSSEHLLILPNTNNNRYLYTRGREQNFDRDLRRK